mmetsp:Transcript_53864/g.140314  ORF Transcript_53864/g.140314 Transcript_53864/m.140314 type:complete len:227 (+) Transcript_53864:564-1244(+)
MIRAQRSATPGRIRTRWSWAPRPRRSPTRRTCWCSTPPVHRRARCRQLAQQCPRWHRQQCSSGTRRPRWRTQTPWTCPTRTRTRPPQNSRGKTRHQAADLPPAWLKTAPHVRPARSEEIAWRHCSRAPGLTRATGGARPDCGWPPFALRCRPTSGRTSTTPRLVRAPRELPPTAATRAPPATRAAAPASPRPASMRGRASCGWPRPARGCPPSRAPAPSPRALRRS